MTKRETNKPDQVAIVTGASTGIGKAIATEFLTQNYTVVLISRPGNRLTQTINQLKKKHGKRVIAYPTDLSNIDDIIALVKKVTKQFGQIDVLINAAGIYHDEHRAYADTPLGNFDIDQILQTLCVGLTAPLILAHGLTQRMPPFSKIINISGTFEDGATGWLPYFVSKKALEQLTVGLADELKPQKIQVNCISPSDTLTESYKKFFPQYANKETCLNTGDIVNWIRVLIDHTTGNNISGQILEIKRN